MSFIRGTINYYAQGGGVTRGAVPATMGDFAEREVISVRPLAGDATKLEISFSGATYAIPPNDKIVLSEPLTYTDETGRSVDFPAHTLIAVAGGTPGSLDGTYNTQLPSTIWIEAGRPLRDGGAVEIKNTSVLHANFFKTDMTPRKQVADYVTAANAWLAQGFCLDHSGPHEQLDTLHNRYGIENISRLREQEWSFFAQQGWDPKRVLICNANEVVWGGATKLPRADRWARGYKDYLQHVYTRLRHHFPNHTLGLGTGNGDAPLSLQGVDWWPDDPNTLLTVHGYPDDGGWFESKVDGLDLGSIEGVLDGLSDTQKRLRIPQVYWQEFGNKKNREDHNLKLANMRKAVLKRGWLAAAWGADIDSDFYRVALKDKNGLWRPAPDSLGAFGLK